MTRLHRIRVLWLVDHLGYAGSMHGGGRYYLNTVSHIDRDRFEVILCVLRAKDKLTELFENRGIDITHLGRSKLDPLTLADVTKLIKKREVELIHVHGYGSANFGRLSGRMCGIPVILHAHDDDRNYPFHQKLADRLLRNVAVKAIAVSESVKKSCIEKRRIPADRVLVLHNGIPLDEFRQPEPDRIERERARLGVPQGVKVIGCVAKLREEKGVRYLVESAPAVLRRHPEAFFLLAGDGPQRQELETLGTQLGVGKSVKIAGFCQDVPAVLAMADIMVMPSLTEGSPLALLEAMAMGKPIIATSVGGIPEILKDGESGLLTPPADPASLAENIITLLDHTELAAKLASAVGAESLNYDIKVHAGRLQDLYALLLRPRDQDKGLR